MEGRPISYTVAGCSGHSGKYHAHHIIENTPHDDTSRWSGGGGDNQWILLRLDALSVVTTITFGKINKTHPCNMKEFKVYLGVNEDSMDEVLHSTLKNDTTPELFSIYYRNSAGNSIPTRFVKIEPISSHAKTFHTSIWHVAIIGTADKARVNRVKATYDEHRETNALRHILKHLRERRLFSSYTTLVAQTGLQLEHPVVTTLHEAIILRGDWQHAESLLLEASSAGLFDEHLKSQRPGTLWTRLNGVDADGDRPCARGGHAMCIDQAQAQIYLFGGFDGTKHLDDFWRYDIGSGRWTVLSHGTTSQQNAPNARACHNMVFDESTGNIFLLGRLPEESARPQAPEPPAPRIPVYASDSMPIRRRSSAIHDLPQASTPAAGPPARVCSQFFCYHTRGIDAEKWDLVQFDTASAGGPPLVFDHQMVMDSGSHTVFVSGGSVVDGDPNATVFGGFYAYHVPTSKWTHIELEEASCQRSSHSMVMDQTTRTLYIFAGGRHEDKFCADVWSYQPDSNMLAKITSNFTAQDGPDPLFGQRALLDPILKEIYITYGLSRSQNPGSPTILQPYPWIYRYEKNTWAILSPATEGVTDLPRPRFAHAVVYHEETKTVFMHGGNSAVKEESPMEDGGEETRLDDFWSMNLHRHPVEECIRRMKYLIRRQQFREMCQEQPLVQGLDFLQNEVSAVVDHKVEKEAEMFRSLLAHLFGPEPTIDPAPHTPGPSSTTKVRQPDGSFTDDGYPAKKRSRADTPEGACGGEELADATFSHLKIAPPPQKTVDLLALKNTADVEERRIVGGKKGEPGREKFEQRTEVYEALLDFVNEDAKQPVGDLWSMES